MNIILEYNDLKYTIDNNPISLNNPVKRGDLFIDIDRDDYNGIYVCDIGTTTNFVLTKNINFPISCVRKLIKINQLF